ncbi:hypothetical protein PC128_g21951 [Phytophthora cactorum]|nr:hypothetical protein PC128_g21951 [Phytophthora cactorum]
MECANHDCAFAELTTTDPCVVGGRAVHHLCSNELYDAGNLSERICCAVGLYQWRP